MYQHDIFPTHQQHMRLREESYTILFRGFDESAASALVVENPASAGV
jgi:hypothetical protein